MIPRFAVACAVLAVAHLSSSFPAARQNHPEAGLTLDFFVTGPDGTTPAALEPSELVLKVGGRERPIRSLELISPPDAATGPLSIAGAPPSGVSRKIALIVDESTLYGLEPIVKDAVSKFLAALSPRDMVAFISTKGRGRQTNLTPSHETVANFVDSMITGPGVLWSCQRELMGFIASLADSVPSGRSTSIAVISRGSPRGASFAGDAESGPCAPRRDDLRALEEAVAAAQINLHLLTVAEEQRSWGFDTIAGNTGGSSALLSWNDAGALERAVKSTSHYYRATFSAEGVASNRTHRVELRTSRPGHKVRTSPMIRIP